MRPRFIVLLILMNIGWSATYTVFKHLQLYLTAGQVVTLRYSIGAAVLVLAWPWLPGRAPRGMDILKTIIMGLLVFVLGSRLQVAAVHLGKASDASVLMALEPLIASATAAWFLAEKLPVRRWIGLGCGMSGVVLLARVWRDDFHLPSMLANSLMLLSFLCETPWSLMGKFLIGRASLLKVVAIALFSGAVVNGLLDGTATFTAAAQLPVSGWLLLGYLGLVCTVAGYSFWYVVIRETEVNIAALTVFVQPVAGLMFAFVLLGEQLHWGQLWGSLAIVAGLAIGLPRRNGA